MNPLTIERDVALFFVQQAEYEGINDDLAMEMYRQPYWFALVGDEELRVELHWGCLAIIFAMAACEAGNVAHAFGGAHEQCRTALLDYEPPDDTSRKLWVLAMKALDVACMRQDERDWDAVKVLIGRDARAVHELSVRQFFLVIASRWADVTVRSA